jgi:hypothetical protein
MTKKAFAFGILFAISVVALLGATTKIDLTAQVQGILPFSHGGLGTNTNFAAHNYFGNNTASSAAPSPVQPSFGDLTGAAFPFNVALPNLKFIGTCSKITATGDQTVYTVPANRRAFWYTVGIFNNSGGTGSFKEFVQVSGTSYYFNAAASVGNNAGSFIAGSTPTYVAEAGEKFGFNSTVQPYNVCGGIFEFDNTSSLATAKLLSLINGDNTIYTVTSGKTAVLLGGQTGWGSGNSILYSNASGSSVTVHPNFVPSGGSPGTANQFGAATSIATGTIQVSGVQITLNSGDFVSLNASSATATQWAYVTRIEF